jgi:hypothetical protein
MDSEPYDETGTTVEQFDAMWKEAEPVETVVTPPGKYDFKTPTDLETRVQNLINSWRHSVDEAFGDDEGSITIMADQLERVLRGPEL